MCYKLMSAMEKNRAGNEGRGIGVGRERRGCSFQPGKVSLRGQRLNESWKEVKKQALWMVREGYCGESSQQVQRP